MNVSESESESTDIPALEGEVINKQFTHYENQQSPKGHLHEYG